MKHINSKKHPGGRQWHLALLFITIFTAGILSTTTAANDETPVAPNIVVKGNGNDIATVNNTPRIDHFTDFAHLEVKKERILNYTIENTGNATLQLTGPTFVEIKGLHPDDFVVTKQPAAAVEPGQTTTFEITFTPGASGDRNAMAGLLSNDPDQKGYVFRIKGTGYVIPEITNVSAVTADGLYGIGKTIRLKVDFNEQVKLTEVIPAQISLNAGATAKAQYAEGDKHSTIYFDYTVGEGESTTDLDYLNTDAFDVKGGILHSIWYFDAKGILTLPAPGADGSLSANSNIQIDGIAPSGYTVAFDQNEATIENAKAISFTITNEEANATCNWGISGLGADKITGSGDLKTLGAQITGIDVSAFDDGELTLSITLTDKAGNQGSAALAKLIKQPFATDIGEKNINHLEVYPSITTGMITVKADNIDNIIIYNVTGNMVYQKKTTHQPEETIDLSACENGIYLIQVRSTNDWEMKKIIKK
ncbi:MAG: choice-of-anchor D domain-containing protein [Marinilabiliaceae bacterium]|nr:choice-of-anchor D domain-containing protein [Marinilabiliaceae bacterium]